jgi:hypothetical protein
VEPLALWALVALAAVLLGGAFAFFSLGSSSSERVRVESERANTAERARDARVLEEQKERNAVLARQLAEQVAGRDEDAKRADASMAARARLGSAPGAVDVDDSVLLASASAPARRDPGAGPASPAAPPGVVAGSSVGEGAGVAHGGGGAAAARGPG